MSDILGISSNAISVYQRALTTVSNNIANVNTEGYSRQDVVIQDSAPKKMANMYMGTGAMLQTIKRQFDAFAESNLRNSASDLASQKPMVDYTKRVMDVMGDKSIGLSSALDNFFAAASALSVDPASTVLRTSLLQNSEGVASRFAELSGQMDLITTETRQGFQSAADQVNTLTSQLALINQNLAKASSVELQPAELLDRRDLTLRQLSNLVRIKTTFTTNGTVNVSLGNTMNDGLVVNGNKARPIGLNSQVKDRIELLLDPYGQTETLSSLSGGQIGGYQTFISQVLNPVQKNLNSLAQVFVDETNKVQQNGIDGYGDAGQNLFGIASDATQTAAGIHVALNDGMRVATAAQFRVSEGNSNTSATRATVRYQGQVPSAALSNSQLVNNPNANAGVTFKVDASLVYAPVTTLSAGVSASFYLNDAKPGQQLQVLTRDGRQLLGQSLSETEKYQLFNSANGFAANANYSDQYLNQTGEKAYRGLDLFYGAKSTVLYKQNFDINGAAMASTPMPAVLETGRISANGDEIPAGALQLNGVELGALKIAATPTDVAAWLNEKQGQTNIRAEAFNEIRVKVSQIDPSKQLTINGKTVSGYKTVSELVTAINESVDIGVKAELDPSGELVISNDTGESIQINPNSGSKEPRINALGQPPGVYDGQVRMVQVVRDMRIPATDLNFNRPLEINGINFNQAAYSLPAGNLSATFGYPATTVTGLDAQTLADNLNASSKQDEISIDGISFGATPSTSTFTSFTMKVDGKLVQLDGLNPATADLAGLQNEIQSRLQALDGGSTNITVAIDATTGKLTVSDAMHRQLSNISLNASPTVDLATVSTGIQLARFSDSFVASTLDGKLVIKSFDSTLSDSDIANLILVKKDTTQVQADAGVTTKQGLIDRINAEQIKTGVVASLDANQDIVLSTTDTNGTREISIGPGTTVDGKTVANALGLPAYDYGVTERLQRLLLDDPTKKDIRLSFGSYIAGNPPVKTFGDPANLKTIGLRTGAFVEGGCPDDLLLFVTGKGAANVAVGFSGQPDDLRKTLRTQSLQVKFTAPDRYSIIDSKTGTQLADRNYDPNVLEPMIDFEGLQIKLSHAPAVGDVFQIDGNQDGLANNVNMLDMVDLNKKPVINGKTIANAYIDQINNVGNLAQQANINQAALTVVNDQAVAARDKVSGVNLDDEAAALIRYQQAYQAAAKALQVSGQLFDAVVQIR